MRVFDTKDGQTINIQVTKDGKVILACDSFAQVTYVFEASDAARIAENLCEASKDAEWAKKNGRVVGPFA